MQLRRHDDIVAFRNGTQPPVAFHSRNLEVATVTEDIWNSMAPTTFENGFLMKMEPNEVGVDLNAYEALLSWQTEENQEVVTRNFGTNVKTLTLNVTQLCNLHCTYCAAGGDGTYGDPVAKISLEKTLPQIDFFLSKLNPGESFQITFLGGEPLLYPDAIKHIALHAKKVASDRRITTIFNVITNATLVNEKSLEVLTAIRANITVSIDGPPETHDLSRPQKNGQGSSTAVLAGLDLLLRNKAYLGRILLHGVFSRKNLEVVKAYEFFKGLGVDAYEFTFDATESDRDVSAKFMSEMTKVAELAYSAGGEVALRKISMFDSYFRVLDEQIRTENHCGSGKSLLSLDSRNKVYACPLDVGIKNEIVGELQDIDDSKLEDLKSTLIAKNNCQTCWARFLCGGGCMFTHKSLTGNKHKKHISFCERTRYLISLTLMYYEQCRG